jgi:hypothetical protein
MEPVAPTGVVPGAGFFSGLQTIVTEIPGKVTTSLGNAEASAVNLTAKGQAFAQGNIAAAQEKLNAFKTGVAKTVSDVTGTVEQPAGPNPIGGRRRRGSKKSKKSSKKKSRRSSKKSTKKNKRKVRFSRRRRSSKSRY